MREERSEQEESISYKSGWRRSIGKWERCEKREIVSENRNLEFSEILGSQNMRISCSPTHNHFFSKWESSDLTWRPKMTIPRISVSDHTRDNRRNSARDVFFQFLSLGLLVESLSQNLLPRFIRKYIPQALKIWGRSDHSVEHIRCDRYTFRWANCSEKIFEVA
jgi:hypothetical protein